MKINLSQVETRCVVQRCSVDWPLDRHHVRSQKLFVHHFRHKRKSRKYKDFVKRYYEFSKEDIVLVCRDHHGEVHRLYARVIAKHCWKLRLRLRDFTWKQAEILMKDFELEFNEWVARKNAA